MKEATGNIWDWAAKGYLIVIPTNIGWTKREGYNVMGRGLAHQAAQRYPGLDAWYGHWCRSLGAATGLTRYESLLLFPVKPLRDPPWLSWQQRASLELIERSAEQLAQRIEPVVLPLVGCGNGGLKPEAVLPILQRWLTGGNFVLVRYA